MIKTVQQNNRKQFFDIVADKGSIGVGLGTPYSRYSMSMAYNVMSSPVTMEKDINGTFSKNDYLYAENQPNAPVQVGGVSYTYSASGNPLTITGAGVDRSLTWDAENRLRMIEDNESGTLHLYTYNHLGERALKRFGTAQTMAINGRTVATLLDTNENYSAYVSPYFVENNNRYTKHYYAGAMRLASKIGGAVYKGVEEAGGSQGGEDGAVAEGSKDLKPGATYIAGTDEPDLYFYFTDHLGSTTYITDREEVAQYVAYTPYGETFKEYRNVTPYKFNGKELDQETGYYYYGARYYDPGTALWFGTDPLAHINPQVSPYVYCQANPIRRIDPNGMIDYDIDGMDDTKWHNFNTSEDVIRLPEFEACASTQPKTCSNQQSENNSKYNCAIDYTFNTLGYLGYGTACGAEYNKYEKMKWSLLEKKYQNFPISNSANKKKMEYALRYKWLYKTNLVLGIASTAYYGHQSYENPTFENQFDLSVSVISLMGTYGTAAAAIIETYRPAIDVLIEITNKINTKVGSLNNWFEFYNFGFYW